MEQQDANFILMKA